MNEKSKFQLPDFGAGQQSRADQSPRRRLLEETKLSRRAAFSSRIAPGPTSEACSVCGGRLEADSDFQQSTKVCRKCIGIFAKVGAAFDEHADRKARAAKLVSFAERLGFEK